MLVFVVVVLAVARLRGLMALLGLGSSGAVVAFFVLPALLTGEPAIPVAVRVTITLPPRCGSCVAPRPT